MVEKYVEQVGALVGNMLRYARAERPEPEPIDPAAVVQAVLERCESRAEMIGIAVKRDIAPDLESVTMDVTGIHSCLANLVANAINACAWGPDTDKEDRVRVAAAPREACGVVLSAVNNGKGIAPEDPAKLLRTSFTAKSIHGPRPHLGCGTALATDGSP